MAVLVEILQHLRAHHMECVHYRILRTLGHIMFTKYCVLLGMLKSEKLLPLLIHQEVVYSIIYLLQSSSYWKKDT